jgi:murein DD-endopeptidase MepM/ murein hydrolase activator NlpD
MIVPALQPSPDADREKLRAAARSLEAMFLKQLVAASGAFGGGDGPGSSIRADLFATTLSDTLAKHGGIGLAAQIERSLSGEPPPAPDAAPLARPRAFGSVAPRGPTATDTDLHAAAPTAPLPVDGRVTSRFGPRADPFTGAPALHRGLDVAAPAGTPIRAAAGGTVLSAGPRGGYGEAVEIDHGDGTSALYAHASALLVRPGERVEPGQEIARVGSSGRATGAHLHFEVRQGERAVDPLRALGTYRRRGLIEPAGRADGPSGAGK